MESLDFGKTIYDRSPPSFLCHFKPASVNERKCWGKEKGDRRSGTARTDEGSP
jgi:hypothetical protein